MTFLKDLKFEFKDLILIGAILGSFYKYDQKQTENFHKLEIMIEKLSTDYYNSKDNHFKFTSALKPSDLTYRKLYMKNEAILPQAPKVPEREDKLL